MLLVVVSLAGALAVGFLLGGSLRRLGAQPVRGLRLLAGAFVLQVAGGLLTILGVPLAHPVSLATSTGLVALMLVRNRRLPGLALVALGLAANATVVALNGAMPVSSYAALRAGVDVAVIAAGDDPRHELAGPGTRLRLLGDVLPVGLPPRPEVASPGDVLVAAGLAGFVVMGMRRAPRRYQVPARPVRRPAGRPVGG